MQHSGKHQLTGRPIIASEIYLAARENRSANRNSKGVFPVVDNQPERAAALRRTLVGLGRTPYVLGADWFQYFDEPPLGREDGEDYNFGLVDIHDRPYEEVTAAFGALDVASLRSRAPLRRADASAGVPPAPPDPLGKFAATQAFKHWDRERGFVKPVSEFPLADLPIRPSCANRFAQGVEDWRPCWYAPGNRTPSAAPEAGVDRSRF
jgi:hypothetical protein